MFYYFQTFSFDLVGLYADNNYNHEDDGPVEG